MTIGPLAFTTPWLLLALIALPLLWLLLRAVPPTPVVRRFPGVALLLGLSDEETQTDKTPWWLLLLRALAIAAVILGFAGPVLNPQTSRTGEGPVLVLIDGTWADARGWNARLDRADALLTEAARQGRPAALALATDPPAGPLEFQSADGVRSRLAGLTPNPWAPLGPDWLDQTEGAFETYWLSDGLQHAPRADLLEALSARGAVTVFEGGVPALALLPVAFEDGAILITATRLITGSAQEVTVTGFGPDPSGTLRALAEGTVSFDAGEAEATLSLSVPAEIRNRLTRFELSGIRSAAAVTLTDDALQRREVALLAGRSDREGLELLSPLHYLEQALEPTADLLSGALLDILPANPDAIILADVAQLSEGEAGELKSWVEAGGLLVRFAGPRLAASDIGRGEGDPLLPVRLRAGGRTVGGAMSWGEPKSLRPFDEGSPFFGLQIPAEVAVRSQVMAEPDPTLADRSIASLSDGTPLVTRAALGQGQVVLFHVTANAEWSSLPLSGLFVQMLERLAVSTRPAAYTAEELEGTTWVPQEVLDGFGAVRRVDDLAGVDGAKLADAALSPELPPGLYAGEDRRIALNVIGSDTTLTPATWPLSVPVEGLVQARETVLKGWLFALALIALSVDVLAALWLSGRLSGQVARASLAALAMVSLPTDGWGQPPDLRAIEATSEVVLAHILTGDPQVDQVAAAGLRGLGNTLFRRTAIEPAAPIGVDLERDELAFYPFLYWPVIANAPLPSADAYAKLNRFLRTGGMILFDTRDADLGGFGAATPEGRALQRIAAPLDIPPLEPIPQDHVLTRAFYLLQDFPGRHARQPVWVEAAPPDAELAEGMPFRNLNDNVTPVVIGGNDWATAWAVTDQGRFMFPVGRGSGGERQREMALRFGVNLLMHVLTGNYKSDQVHVPALLDRLGQ